MSENKEYIDQLFKNAFESYTPQQPNNDWPALDGALTRQNFFKFGFHHFNIFYVSLIGVCIGVGSYVSISANKPQQKPEQKLSTPITDSVLKQNPNQLHQKSYFIKTENKPKQNNIKSQPVNVNNKNTIADTICKSDTSKLKIQTSNLKPDSSTAAFEQPLPTRERKKIIKRAVVVKKVVLMEDTVVKHFNK